MAKPPVADSGLICPLHRKDVAKVCHLCPWYIQVRGVNPNTGSEVDNWGCSISYLPMLTVETAKQARSTTVATESLRNELVKTTGHRAESLETFLGRLPSSPNGMRTLTHEE